MRFSVALLAAFVVWVSIFTAPAGSDVLIAPKRHHVKKRQTRWQIRHHRRQAQRLEVIRAAWRLLGVRYVFGGSGPDGVDCSGLTRYAYSKIGVILPHLAAAQERLGRYIAQRSLRPGDLLFYNDGGHAALYIGNGRMIEASSARGRVIVTDLRDGWFVEHYDQARRLIG